jgi:hypothetical protein
VRSSVQATIEMTRTTRPMLNHVDEKIWKTWSRSRISTPRSPKTGS